VRVLVCGIGNVFQGDDGFGVEVLDRLRQRQLPEGVELYDLGIRGYDLAYVLMEEADAAVLIDALPLGEKPGTLRWVEPDLEALEGPASPDGHAMDPAQVLRMVRQLGGRPPRLFLLGCQPARLGGEEGEMGLSPQVAAAVEPAAAQVLHLLQRLARQKDGVDA
jgi:hydrogenase maturation protease